MQSSPKNVWASNSFISLNVLRGLSEEHFEWCNMTAHIQVSPNMVCYDTYFKPTFKHPQLLFKPNAHRKLKTEIK